VLDPSSSWGSKEDYDNAYRQLAARFIENFRKFADDASPDIKAAGPRK
jgi:phosphoenolpyruvate carboxykinase (ATP)